MSRAKLFNMVKSRGENKTGRNAFDLSNRHVYSQKASKITPIKVFHTYPDDYLEVNLSEFTQNKVPLNTAAFLSGKKEHLAYFVPYNTIWHNFNQYQATREDPESTLLYDKGISYEPRIALRDLYNAALYFCIGDFLVTDYLPIHALVLFHNEAHNKHYFDISKNIPDAIQFMKDNKSGYNKDISFYDYYMQQALEDIKSRNFIQSATPFLLYFDCYENAVLNKTLTYFETFTNMFGSSIWCDWCQKIDMLGYGNIYPVLHKMRMRLKSWVDDNILNNTNSEITNQVIHVTPSSLGGTEYVLWTEFDFFAEGFNPNVAGKPYGLTSIVTEAQSTLVLTCTYKNSDNVSVDEYVNPYAIYAYNKCFYDYMRNVYYDTDYCVYNYNCDFINGKTLDGSIISEEFIPLRWYHLEPHQWKKDMFTGVLPDNQLGQVSEVILSATVGSAAISTVSGPASWKADDPLVADSVLYADATPGLITAIHADNQGTNVNINHSHSVNAIVPERSINSALNVLALKRAEAIQEYRQDLMRAGNRTQDIFKQVYGTTPKSELDEMPYFIEVSANDLNINPIIATAQTGDGINQSLGDIAARCTIGGSELHFKFSTKDFGVILFLSYIVPDSFYNSYRLDPCVTHLDQEAHGLPYFQNLGLQPVIGSFLSNLKSSSIRNRTLGFAPPYIERKTDIDLVHGDFVDVYLPETSADYDGEFQGEMSHWVVARTDMQQEDTVSLRNFYIDPRILDNVFTFNSGDDYSTDQFFSYCSIQINAVRAFSELGLPRF